VANGNLSNARAEKNDEFYTQFSDIGKEMNAYLDYDPDVFRGKTILLPCDDPEWSNFTRYFLLNFTAFGLKKLISTAYAPTQKLVRIPATDFENKSSKYDPSKTSAKGRIFTVSQDTITHDHLDLEDLEWQYMEGDGDFRSDEVKRLRDEADIIVTNPPFSLFREFLAWIVEADKKFLIVGSMNAITYKEVFPLIKANMIWNGCTHPKEFISPGGQLKKFGNVQWYTNIDHDRRHEPLSLMTMERNLKHSKHQSIKDAGRYLKYDNYDAIDVPFTDAIPGDYDGVMGVPISFLEKYNPEQFDIVGATESEGKGFSGGLWDVASGVSQPLVKGNKVYKRLFIRHRKSSKY
jgi:hypothetical protein